MVRGSYTAPGKYLRRRVQTLHLVRSSTFGDIPTIAACARLTYVHRLTHGLTWAFGPRGVLKRFCKLVIRFSTFEKKLSGSGLRCYVCFELNRLSVDAQSIEQEVVPIDSAVTRMTRGLTGKADDESALVVPMRRTTPLGKILRYPP